MACPPRKPFSTSKKCIEPPLPLEQPVALPSSSAMAALRAHAPGQRVAVVAIRRDHVIIVAEHPDRADSDRFLSAVLVKEAADLVALLIQHLRPLLEAADQHHLPQPDQGLLRLTIGLASVSTCTMIIQLLSGCGTTRAIQPGLRDLNNNGPIVPGTSGPVRGNRAAGTFFSA